MNKSEYVVLKDRRRGVYCHDFPVSVKDLIPIPLAYYGIRRKKRTWRPQLYVMQDMQDKWINWTFQARHLYQSELALGL